MKTPKLGQHFLTRPEIAAWVAESIAISDTDTVLEIGPGRGILTRELLRRAKRVIAIEKDTSLLPELRIVFQQEILSGKLVLIEADIRDFTPSACPHLENGYVLVANIPYYITGYIIRKFLTETHQPSSMAVLVQKEVAERVIAKSGKHSLLSLSVHVYGTPKLGKTVKAGAFSPPPKVDSAILCITDISRKHFQTQQQEEYFFKLIHAGFASKRKMLFKQAEHLLSPSAFSNCIIPETVRAEDLSLEQWLCLTQYIK